jgi:hypothetical protein
MKELQEKMVATMKRWQKIEDESVVVSSQMMAETDNPIIRMAMEIIQSDSRRHHRVQGLMIDILQGTISLTPEELGEVSKMIDRHVKLEKQMVKAVEEALSMIKGKKMVVQEYLLNYLMHDEKKHTAMLNALEKVKIGMYPYGSP